MATNRSIQNFNELRTVLDVIRESTQAMLDFLDTNGIGLGTPRTKARVNGNGNGATAKLERVKRQYTQHRPAMRISTTPPPREAPAPKLSSAELKYQQRTTSAAFLDQFDTVEPRNVGRHPALGALARRGYLKKKGNGHVRTSKVFIVGPAPKTTSAPASPPPASSDSLSMKDAAVVLRMSEANVRLLASAGKIQAHKELRVRAGMIKAVPTIMVPRAEVERYAAEQGAL